jgi:hypothetical protein
MYFNQYLPATIKLKEVMRMRYSFFKQELFYPTFSSVPTMARVSIVSALAP